MKSFCNVQLSFDFIDTSFKRYFELMSFQWQNANEFSKYYKKIDYSHRIQNFLVILWWCSNLYFTTFIFFFFNSYCLYYLLTNIFLIFGCLSLKTRKFVILISSYSTNISNFYTPPHTHLYFFIKLYLRNKEINNRNI